jgi:regulator of sigma D
MLVTGIKFNHFNGTYAAGTTKHPFTIEISADEAREIIGRAFSDNTIQTIMQWEDDEVLTLELSELMELEQALDEIAEQADYEESIADWLAQ